MDSYLKELLANSNSPSINIVDDNVHPSIDPIQHTNNVCSTQQDGQQRPLMIRSRSMMEQRRRQPHHQIKQKPRVPSWSHANGQSKWDSFSGEKPSLKLQRWTSEDSVLAKPRRSSRGSDGQRANRTNYNVKNGDNLDSEQKRFDAYGNEDNAIDSAQKLLSSVLDRKQGQPSRDKPLHDEILPFTGSRRLENEASSRDSCHSDPHKHETGFFGTPYLVSLKSDSPTFEKTHKDISGPPEQPQRRASDESITLVAALEAAVAASPLSSGENSLVHPSAHQQDTKEISEALLRTHLTTNLAPSSLRSSTNQCLPPAFRELPYDTGSVGSSHSME